MIHEVRKSYTNPTKRYVQYFLHSLEVVLQSLPHCVVNGYEILRGVMGRGSAVLHR